MKLTSIHKHNKITSICRTVCTGNWQKDFFITRAVRKSHRKSDRKARKVNRLGPVPLGGGSEEKDESTVETCSGSEQ